jgi:hypothetical protein
MSQHAKDGMHWRRNITWFLVSGFMPLIFWGEKTSIKRKDIARLLGECEGAVRVEIGIGTSDFGFWIETETEN